MAQVASFAKELILDHIPLYGFTSKLLRFLGGVDVDVGWKTMAQPAQQALLKSATDRANTQALLALNFARQAMGMARSYLEIAGARKQSSE